MSEQPFGMMVYGYSLDNADVIRESLSSVLGAPVEMICGSGMEDRTVMDILDSGGSETFSEGEVRIVMFLGLDDAALSQAVDGFPRREGLQRPIFCCLTQENIDWKLSELIGDLLEEDRYWRSRKAPPSEPD